MRWSLLLLVCLSACAPEPKTAGPRIAAVALRDDVPGYQQWATERFTVPVLEDAWDAHTYLTATPSDSRETEFLEALRHHAASADAVDVFLLAHGNRYDTWAAKLDPVTRAKLRLVYNTGAGDASQGPHWLALGAKAYVGHPGNNVAPVFYQSFLRAWAKGRVLKDAVKDANAETRGSLTNGVTVTALEVLEQAGGPRLNASTLWRGTEAQLDGDATLTVR